MKNINKIKKAIINNQTKKSDYRLRFHVTPPTGLLNDPNGLIYFEGKYHLFYQWCPLDLSHKDKYWGHMVSEDLVRWRTLEMPYVLAPEDKYDKDGCYSGSVIVDDGEMYAIYTGNVGHGEEGPNRRKTSNQLIAKYNRELEAFEKETVLIKGVPFGYTPHFRDPKVWQQHGSFFTIIGAQRRNKTGTAIVYSGKKLHKMRKIGEIKLDKEMKQFGYMWECPDIFKLEGKDVFIFSPQGVEPSGYKYQNKYQSGYIVGLFDETKAEFDQFSKFEELDRGHEFYAPQTYVTEDGRRILIAWMGMPEQEEHPTIKEGWMHALTIPRELTMKGNKLIQKPIQELEQLRENETEYTEFILEDEVWEREEFIGDTYELHVDANIIAETFEVVLKNSVRVVFDSTSYVLTLERQGAHPKYKENRSVQLPKSKKLELQIFLDRSSIEIFVNGGEEVFTSRVFPKKDARAIQLKAINGVVEVNKIKKYDIEQIYYAKKEDLTEV